jgi:ferredoxin-NADP reductase
MEARPQPVRFHASVTVAPATAMFQFGKPAGYSFRPGQYFSLTLDTREGSQTKPFSHCNAPGDPHIELTTRLTGSAFKDALLALRHGDEVTIAGPRGRLTVSETASRVAFLVGGVGITPARSIIRDAVQRGTGLEVLCFDGNLDQTGIPFKDEFDGYEASHPEIRFVHVLMEPLPGWDGERGFITAEVVRRHCDPLDRWHWISAGPPAMATAMQKVFADLSLPDDRVSMELFTGYE